MPFIPAKKLQSDNIKSVKSNNQGSTVNISQSAKQMIDIEDLDSSSEVDSPLKWHALVLENSKSCSTSTQSSHGGHKEVINIDTTPVEAIQGPKHAATQLKEVSNLKACVSFASACSTTPKPFIPLDPASIHWGLQEGSASSKKEDLKKGTYIMLIKMAKTIKLIWHPATAFVSEEIQFFPLPRVSFKELMSNLTQIIVIYGSLTGNHFHVHLIYNPEERIGKGTFKTANLASLEFDGMRPLVGLGSVSVDKLAVALKCPFLDTKVASKRHGLWSVSMMAPVSRLTVTDEQHMVTGEAKLLVWVNALLEFAYDFIFDYTQNNYAPPGVEDFLSIIPLFCFVDAGVAMVVKPMETLVG